MPVTWPEALCLSTLIICVFAFFSRVLDILSQPQVDKSQRDQRSLAAINSIKEQMDRRQYGPERLIVLNKTDRDAVIGSGLVDLNQYKETDGPST